MSPKREDRWRMPELERLGDRFRAAEAAERVAEEPHWWQRKGSRWRRGLVGLLAILAGAAGVLELVAPAGASSPVNRAPAAAERSGSVRFNAMQVITVGGRPLTNVRETGELNFVSRDFATTLVVGEGREQLERRRVADTLYFRRVTPHTRQTRTVKWTAVRVASSDLRAFSPPGGYTLIDPQVAFRVMTGARSPVAVIGTEEIGGIRSTHYQVATSLNAFVAAEQAQHHTTSSRNDVSTLLNVWLDGRGRPLRVQSTFSSELHGRPATMTTAVNFADYGAAALVRAPAEAAILTSTLRASQATLADPTQALERLLFGTPHR